MHGTDVVIRWPKCIHEVLLTMAPPESLAPVPDSIFERFHDTSSFAEPAESGRGGCMGLHVQRECHGLESFQEVVLLAYAFTIPVFLE